MEKDYTIKILLLGGSGVGKSAIVRRFAGRSFDRREKPTIGIDVAVVDYGHIEDRKVRLEFWDVGSRELHGSANHHLLALRDVAGILLVADASNAASFAAVDQWRALVAKHLASREISTLLMMHRCDLLGGGAMPFDDAALTAYASAAGLCGWRWTTARTGSTVKDAVERLVEVIFASLGALDLVDRAAPYILHGRAHAATRLMEGEERGGGGGAPRPPLAACVRPPLVIVDDGDDEGDDEGDAALFPSALVQLTTTAITSEPRPGDGGDGAEDAAPMAPDADAPGAFLSAPVLVLVEHLLQTTSDYYANLAARLAVLVEARRGVALAGGDLDQLLETVRRVCRACCVRLVCTVRRRSRCLSLSSSLPPPPSLSLPPLPLDDDGEHSARRSAARPTLR
jgi:small GTP-binding protein